MSYNSKHDIEVVEKIVELKSRGLSSREIASSVLGRGTAKSTVNDIWKAYTEGDLLIDKKPEYLVGPRVLVVDENSSNLFSIQTSKPEGKDLKHLVIPDTQCKPGISLEYLSWLGEYIVDQKPDVIVHLGDHADMPSLSSYDKGKRSAEGKRVYKDIESATEGMVQLLKPLYDLQNHELKETGKISYKPRLVLTLGNHEQRIKRHVDANPELEGFLSYDNLKYEDFGWEVYDFLEPVIVNGITYCHYMPNPMTGKPYGGMAMNILKNVGESFTMGHKQTLDIATRFLPASGRQQWAIIAGAYYEHDEDYKSYQGNKHWRGVIVKHNVKDGSYNPMFVDLDYLKRRYADY